MASTERGAITGVCRRSPDRGPGTQGVKGETHEAESFSAAGRQLIGKISPSLSYFVVFIRKA